VSRASCNNPNGFKMAEMMADQMALTFNPLDKSVSADRPNSCRIPSNGPLPDFDITESSNHT
jgi:hypothetical protein